MRILVLDDNEINRNAAKAQLGQEHELTIVSTYDEARELMRRPFKNNNPLPEWMTGPIKEKGDEKEDFDVVLTDLLVPASSHYQGPEGEKYVGQEMPIGVFIGLLAAARKRAKYVAVFTDSSHHDHPASACFDPFNRGEDIPVPFILNDCRVILSNNRIWVENFDGADLSKIVAYNTPGSIRAKNWKALLTYLLTTSPEDAEIKERVY